MSTNYVSIKIPSSTVTTISAVSNAQYWQIIEVSLHEHNDRGQSHNAQFTGNGEGRSMTCTLDGNKLGNNWVIDTFLSDRDLDLRFFYKVTPQDTAQNDPKTVIFPGTKSTETTWESIIKTEDATDNDDNDTYCHVVSVLLLDGMPEDPITWAQTQTQAFKAKVVDGTVPNMFKDIERKRIQELLDNARLKEVLDDPAVKDAAERAKNAAPPGVVEKAKDLVSGWW